MFSLLKIFFTGLFISFLGALPLGSLNMAAMQIAVEESRRKAIYFSLGVAIVEIAYVRISLQAMNWVLENHRLFYWLEVFTVVLFLVLAISNFWVAFKRNGAAKSILLNNSMNRFWLGFTMSAINPVQIPFWFLWSTYLISNQILIPGAANYNTYIFGIGTGTLTGLALFIVAGAWIIRKLNASRKMIHLVVGLVFIISALLQGYRVLHHTFQQQLTTSDNR